jgi:tuftelin-interacting protein 11
MEKIVETLEQVDDTVGMLTLDGLLQTFQNMKAQYEEEFKMCSIAWIACRSTHPLLIQVFRGWHPLQDPKWKTLLQRDQPFDFADGDASMGPYVQLVSEAILPAVRI